MKLYYEKGPLEKGYFFHAYCHLCDHELYIGLIKYFRKHKRSWIGKIFHQEIYRYELDSIREHYPRISSNNDWLGYETTEGIRFNFQ